MTTATIQLNDARLRGQAVSSAVDLVRNELERNAHVVGLCFYVNLAKYQFRKFRSAIETAPKAELRDPMLAHLGETFEKQADMLTLGVRRCYHVRNSLRFPERYMLDCVSTLASTLDTFGTELQCRAARGERPALRTPKLSGRLAHQAGMAALFMRPTARDHRAEATPDPDYGI